MNEIKVREKKGRKTAKVRQKYGERWRDSAKEKERKKKKKRRYAPVHPGYFFILFPAVGI